MENLEQTLCYLIVLFVLENDVCEASFLKSDMLLEQVE